MQQAWCSSIWATRGDDKALNDLHQFLYVFSVSLWLTLSTGRVRGKAAVEIGAWEIRECAFSIFLPSLSSKMVQLTQNSALGHHHNYSNGGYGHCLKHMILRIIYPLLLHHTCKPHNFCYFCCCWYNRRWREYLLKHLAEQRLFPTVQTQNEASTIRILCTCNKLHGLFAWPICRPCCTHLSWHAAFMSTFDRYVDAIWTGRARETISLAIGLG